MEPACWVPAHHDAWLCHTYCTIQPDPKGAVQTRTAHLGLETPFMSCWLLWIFVPPFFCNIVRGVFYVEFSHEAGILDKSFSVTTEVDMY
jgi:hypothetical protein